MTEIATRTTTARIRNGLIKKLFILHLHLLLLQIRGLLPFWGAKKDPHHESASAPGILLWKCRNEWLVTHGESLAVSLDTDVFFASADDFKTTSDD